LGPGTMICFKNMAQRSPESIELYNVLEKKGYRPEFCELISLQMNTSWTARRMLGYLREVPRLREEDVVDEMLAIMSDRDRIRQKKEMEYYQSKINELYMYGLDADDED